jgi:hypothetical protein
VNRAAVLFNANAEEIDFSNSFADIHEFFRTLKSSKGHFIASQRHARVASAAM